MDELIERGYPLFYGALGENLTTRGIESADIRIGDQIRAGGALLEITQPRGPCSAARYLRRIAQAGGLRPAR